MDKKIFWGGVWALIIMAIPLAFSYYNAKKSLTVSIVSHDIVFDHNINIEGFDVKYYDNNVSYLSKTSLSIENTGRVAITKDDISTPLSISIDGKFNIFDFILLNTDPPNVDAVINKEGDAANVNFSLLNPGDKIYLSILSDSESSPGLLAKARIAGIKDITIKEIEGINLYLTGLAIISFMLSASISFGGVLLLFDYPDEYRLKRKIKDGDLDIPVDSVEIVDWVFKEFHPFTRSEMKKLISYLLPTKDEKKKKLNAIRVMVRGFTGNLMAGLIFFLFGIAVSIGSFIFLVSQLKWLL